MITAGLPVPGLSMAGVAVVVAIRETRLWRTGVAVMAGSSVRVEGPPPSFFMGGSTTEGWFGGAGYLLVAVRWVPVKLKATVLLRFWKVLSAVDARVRVTRRLSLWPELTEVRLFREMFEPVTAPVVRTEVVVPEQV
ncbi:MAG: hypothetical protein M3017_02460 [Actinomycetota bacterium]|nr:hypothetical protein [Actinomycetota bacterium]